MYIEEKPGVRAVKGKNVSNNRSYDTGIRVRTKCEEPDTPSWFNDLLTEKPKEKEQTWNTYAGYSAQAREEKEDET